VVSSHFVSSGLNYASYFLVVLFNRNSKGNRSYPRASRVWNAFLQRSGFYFVAEAASFGANEATIFSKRGSPRSGSQTGNSFKAP
jgi:hypothetical protein